jgi:hypothetical protein
MGSRAVAEHTIEMHDDASKEFGAGLRPVDHYKHVSPLLLPNPGAELRSGNQLTGLAPGLEVSSAAVAAPACKMGDTLSRRNAGKLLFINLPALP